MRMSRTFLDVFWDEDFWLPASITWEDIAPGPANETNVVYPDPKHIVFYSIPLAFSFMALRYILQKYWYAPFGKSLGIKDTRSRKAACNPKLEAAYQTNHKLKQPSGLAKQLDLTERQVERWWRLRRSQDKPSTLVKFCESCWKFSYYVLNFSFGMFILWDKEWLWDIDYACKGYPHQGLTDDIWWYYIISSAFYWSLTISQFWDVKRKDFWQMFLHHIVTLGLLYFSWVTNFYRLGSLILVLHDCADIFIEAMKAAKYANYQKLCDAAFFTLTGVWLVTRMYIFPFHIIWFTMFRTPALTEMRPAYYVFIAALLLLQALHVVWTAIILQIAYRFINFGKMDRDLRSSSSELSDSPNSSHHSTPRRHRK